LVYGVSYYRAQKKTKIKLGIEKGMCEERRINNEQK
jgi:hypothetical protein